MGLFNTSKAMLDAIKGVVTDGRKQYAEEQQQMDKLVAEKILSPKQKKIASVAGDKEKIDAADFAALRAGKKVAEDVESVDEMSSKEKMKKGLYNKKVAEAKDVVVKDTEGKVKSWYHEGDWKKSAGKDPKGKVANLSDKARRETEKMAKEEVEVDEAAERDTPGQHSCAVHVKHSTFGEGKALYSQHAEPDDSGLIEWYDIMFEHGIEKQVPTADLEILEAMSHGNHKGKK